VRRICFGSTQWDISQKSCSSTINLPNTLHGTGTQQRPASSFGNNLQQRWKTPGWNFLVLFLCHIAVTVNAFGYYRNRRSPARIVLRQWLDLSLRTILYSYFLSGWSTRRRAAHVKIINPYTIEAETPEGRDHVGHLNVAELICIEINTEIE